VNWEGEGGRGREGEGGREKRSGRGRGCADGPSRRRCNRGTRAWCGTIHEFRTTDSSPSEHLDRCSHNYIKDEVRRRKGDRDIGKEKEKEKRERRST